MTTHWISQMALIFRIMGLEYFCSHFLQEIRVIIVKVFINKRFRKSVSGYSQMLKAYPAFY